MILLESVNPLKYILEFIKAIIKKKNFQLRQFEKLLLMTNYLVKDSFANQLEKLIFKIIKL